MIQNCLAESLTKNYKAPSYPIYIAINNSIQSVNSKKSMKDAKAEITMLVQCIGSEAQKFVLITLIKSINIMEIKEKTLVIHKLQFLTEVLKEYSENENFLSYFPQVVSTCSKQTKNFIHALFTNLKLSVTTQVIILLAMFLSDRSSYSEEGEEGLVNKLTELRKTEKGGELPERIIEELLFQISRQPQLNNKLEEEYNYLLQLSENCQLIKNDTKIYNYFKGDWQFFSDEVQEIQKPPASTLKKVDYLKNAGPSVTFQMDQLKSIMNDGGPPSEDDIFECLMLMAEEKGRAENAMDRFASQILSATTKKDSSVSLKKVCSNFDINGKKNGGSWNVQNFLTYCTNTIQNLKWQNVLSQFDRQKLVFSSEDQFMNVMKIFEKTKKIGPKWKTPQNLYFKKWVNPYSQGAFLIQVFKCKDPQVLYLHELRDRKIQRSVKDCSNLQKQIWGYLDLLQLLIQVSDYRFMEVRQLLEVPLSKFPEPLLLSLSQIRPNKGQPMLDQIFSQLIPHYLQNHTNNIKFLDNLWELNQDLMISCIAEVYKAQSKKQNSFNLSRVLDITQAIRDSLIPFTTWNDYQFSIPLAIIAGKRQFLNFEPWIVDRIQKVGNSFIEAILKYIDFHLISGLKKIVHSSINQALKESILEKAQLTIELLNKIFYSIMSKIKREDLTVRNFQFLRKLFKDCCNYFPQIAENQIPDQIERQTQREIHKIYKQQISIKEAIDRMKRLKNSQKQQDQEQLASHITFLCSQLPYHDNYPQKQLIITAQLFAALVNANLIEKKVYQMFLGVIEQNLKNDTKKYIFSIKVIQKIKDKLVTETRFCQSLADIELVMKKDPQLAQSLVKALEKSTSPEKLKKIQEAIKLKNSPPLPEPVVTVIPIEQEPAIETLKKVQSNDYDILQSLDETKKIMIPDKENKLSKINMTCNTLSLNNIEEKAKDLQKILDSDKVIQLLVNNIVFKRISIAQNSGVQVFYRLVQKMPQIQSSILKLTYKILLKWFSLQGKSINDSKLKIFKNIGSWLGKLTIARGTPIPIYKLNLKNILIHSFSVSNRSTMDIPVILKILQFISVHPDIFRSTSPWLSRLFGTLYEIQEKLKEDQPTKSEIKAFFRTLQKTDNFGNIPQTSYLNNNHRIIISELDKYIVVDEQLQKYYAPMKINLKMIITQAVDKSIQEIVQPVIDRAVKIAKVTTKQLIMKDFALEPDVEKFRQSSYNMIKKMAGPLAQVTCREPLKASMNRNLKNELSQTFDNEDQIQNIIQKIVPQNLDFGCTLIKQAVIQSAEDVIRKDEAINESIEQRIKARQNGEQFRDQNYIQEIPPIVPEELRPKPGGLSIEEFFIYDQFKKQKKLTSPQKQDFRSSLQKIHDVINEKGPIKLIREELSIDNSGKEEVMTKVHTFLIKEQISENQLSYFESICEVLKQFCQPRQTWLNFKERADLKKKQIHKIVRNLVQKKYFSESCLSQLDQSNQQQSKVIGLFENWLDIAHEEIQHYLRGLEEIFNKSQNQIKMFFSYSLSYAMQKVSESMLQYNESFDTNYVQAYSKLIIISYKTIASNNCSLYFEHTLQAILQVFNRLMQMNSKQISYQRPLFKLFTNLICDVNRKQYDIEKQKILTFYIVLAKELKKISPILHSNFAFAWVELISNKYFMPALLQQYKLWDLYYELLACLLQFAREQITEEHLMNKKNGQAYQYFYKGILKLIIIIIHDFPDFLSEFSLQLCLFPGQRFIQLTNMITSAYPNQIKFESPLKVQKRDKLQAQAKKGGYPKYYKRKFDKEKGKFEQYLLSDSKDASIKTKLNAQNDEILQNFVLFVGWIGEHQLSEPQAQKKLADILQQNNQGLREKLINFIINLIRYPNTITLFFIDFVVGIIFKQNKDSKIRDGILNNIFKRMSAEGPHAWGLLYLTKQLQIRKNELLSLNVPKNILDQL